MSEKPEALRFETSFPYANYEILRVTNSGEFIWNENADQMIAQEFSPHIAHLFRALRRAEVVQAENERLREALALAERLAAGRLAMVEQLAGEVEALRRERT